MIPRGRRVCLLALAAGLLWPLAGARASSAAPPLRARAPSGPPLGAGAAGAGGEGAEAAPEGEADPLVTNGLGSPLCKGVFGAGELPAAGRRNCETSGFVAAPAPTGNYGIDVHIDTGLLGVDPSSAVQDLIVVPVWMAIVWVVHAVVVMLEWCFTLDVLDSASAQVGSGLRQAQAALTQPWLVLVLALASMLALYNGLVRRRVAETLGQALLMGAMMAGGLWVIADPTGTVDALGSWANQASLGTLAAAARGDPAGGGGTLARSMGVVFAATVEAPWCYLEFGDVDWCRNPARLDPRLRAAGEKIAAGQLALVGCVLNVHDLLEPCASKGSAQARALEGSAALLREADSNGALFLALPANGPARNSIDESGSLLRTLCQSSEADACRGPTAAQAEFRTSSGTLARLGGLLLIAAGVLGMVLLLGFIVLRLLAAAIFSLLYLLLAPGMVLAPALGDGGRAVFRKWAAQLLGALVSKLLFSFLLGVVLAVLAILASLTALGWWTQWLLMSAFWWGAFVRRQQALGLAEGALSSRGGLARAHSAGRRAHMRRVGGPLEQPRLALAAMRWTTGKLAGRAPDVERRRMRAGAAGERARAGADRQVQRMLEHELGGARELLDAAPRAQRDLAARRDRLVRIQREQASAETRGETRRASILSDRGLRLAAELERERAQLHGARRAAGDGERAQRTTGRPYAREQESERERFLDAQARLPAARERLERGERPRQRRDYAALAALVGYGREQYVRLDPREQRRARLEIDRELALRSELRETARAMAPERTPEKVGRRARYAADREFDGRLQQRMRERGRAMPRSRLPNGAVDRWREDGRRTGEAPAQRSSVMLDAREVAARRKRQLGQGRP